MFILAPYYEPSDFSIPLILVGLGGAMIAGSIWGASTRKD
jgi:hypothetical protein